MQKSSKSAFRLIAGLLACLLLPFSGNGINSDRGSVARECVLVEAHEFYVGLSDILYNAETRTYEITIKVFTDDLELVLNEMSGKKVVLGNAEEAQAHDDLVFSYVENTFAVKAKNGTALTLQRIGRETEQDVTWIYLESAPMQPLNAAVVSNTMMMEIYEKQTHIVHITQGGKTESALLHESRKSDTIYL